MRRKGFPQRQICLIDLQRQTDDTAIHAPEHFRGIESLLIPFDLLRSQADKMVILWCAAEEEGAKYDVVYLPMFIPQSSIRREIHKLTLFIADQSNRFLKRIDSLHMAAYDTLHSSERIVDFPLFWSLFRFNY